MSRLLDMLIDRGIVGNDTVVTLGNRSRHQSRDYIVINISNHSGGYHLDLREMDGMAMLAASSGEIVAIDGMAVDRYADVYNINRDGSLKSVGKKRGRKPKIR